MISHYSFHCVPLRRILFVFRGKSRMVSMLSASFASAVDRVAQRIVLNFSHPNANTTKHYQQQLFQGRGSEIGFYNREIG